MTTDYRAMCAELVELSAPADSIPQLAERLRKLNELAIRARALLAQPVAEGSDALHPFVVRHYTDDERPSIKGNGFDGLEIGEDRQEAEEFITWINERIRPTPQPVAVSERLPGPEDCDEQGRCWMFGCVEGDWRLISATNSGIPKLKYCFSHWLPANALPTLEATNA